MTMADPIPDDLDAELYGPEPTGDDPIDVPDADTADKLLWHRKRAAREVAQVQEFYDLRHAQLEKWRDEQLAKHQARIDFLDGTLGRYHAAVLARDPKAKTIHLPNGTLEARPTVREWDQTEEFTNWVLPRPLVDLLAAIRHNYLLEAALLVEQFSPLADAVRVKEPAGPEIAVSDMKDALTRRDDNGKPKAYGVLPTGEQPPGLTVHEPKTKYSVKS